MPYWCWPSQVPGLANIRSDVDQVPVPLTGFRSNSKLGQNLDCSYLKCAWLMTTKFCTCHNIVTVVTCAKFRCDWLNILRTRVLRNFIQFGIWSKYLWWDERRRPTNRISIEFEIQSKFKLLLFKICPTYDDKILYMSQQCYCCDVCKISLWLAEYIMNKSITKFHSISNLIKISLVGQRPRASLDWQRLDNAALNLGKVMQ